MKHALLFPLVLTSLLAGCSDDDSKNDWIDTGPVELREPYACGWEQGDPGDLQSTGAGIGDVVADWGAPDQCGEEYRLWDGTGSFTLLMSVAYW